MTTVYSNGTLLSPVDLLQKLVSFLIINGWTSDSSTSDGAGWRAHLHRGTTYINLRAAINEASSTMFDDTQQSPWSGVALYVGDGYSSSSSWKNQSGGPKNKDNPTRTVGAGMVLTSGAMPSYHFFSHDGGDHITVVVEVTTGIYRHIGWGISLKKVGNFTGGQYFYGSTSGNYLGLSWGNYPGFNYTSICPGCYNDGRNNGVASTFFRADVDSFTNKWIGVISSSTGSYGATGKRGASCFSYSESLGSNAPAYASYVNRLTNTVNTQSLLLPIRLLAERDAGGYSFAGSIPNVFLCNSVSKGFAPASTYLWGSETYLVFPGPATAPELGFAVRKA